MTGKLFADGPSDHVMNYVLSNNVKLLSILIYSTADERNHSFEVFLTLSGEWTLRNFWRESGRLSCVEFVESGVESVGFSWLPCSVDKR